MDAVEYFPFTPCPLFLLRRSAGAGASLAVDQVIVEFEWRIDLQCADAVCCVSTLRV